MSRRIVPIILCGGGGTRLWPASTTGRPKPFLPLVDGTTTFAGTLARVSDPTLFAAPVIVANRSHAALIEEALAGAEADIVLEPEARDTAPAIAAAAAFVAARDPAALLLVLAADHLIRDIDGFRATIRAAIPAVEAGRIVVFGVRPTAPLTSYGYIRVGDVLAGHGDVRAVAAFVEKPDEERATAYLDAGYLWNSGNFMMSAATAAAELAAHAPGLAAAAIAAVAEAGAGGRAAELALGPFRRADRISFDHAVMERTGRAAVVEARFDWSDLGTWSSVWEAATKDEAGNVVEGDAVLVDARDNYVSTDRPLVGILGLDDIVVVASDDAMLVAPRSRADALKDLVGAIGKKSESRRARRSEPWGSVQIVDSGEGYRVSRVVVDAGEEAPVAAIGRGETRWTLVRGAATLMADGVEARRLGPGDSVVVSTERSARFANPGAAPLVLIVVERAPGA